jgi:inner membrane protein
MMSRTHLAMGMASSLATSFFVMQPENLSDNLIVLSGGALGGVLADVDTVKNDYKCDALIGQLLGFSIFISVTVLDYIMELGVCDYVINKNRIPSIIAGIAFIVLYTIGFASNHRTFTHSLLAMILFSGCFSLTLPRLGCSILIGYASHMLLDLLNKKDVPLLYPLKKGICFKLCYAGKTANTIFMIIGFMATLVLFGYRLYPYIIH